MTRIPAHTIADAPAAARPLLAEMIQFSPTGRLLNMHAQMAHAPAVLEAYVSIRRATARHGTLDQRTRTALMLVAAAADASPYALAIISQLALRSGWQPDQVAALLAGQDTGEDKLDALTGVVREAAANSGRVSGTTWGNAVGQGWGDEQLAQAFAYLGLTVSPLTSSATPPPSSTSPRIPPAPVKEPDMDLVQSRIVTDDVARLAAFYASLVQAEVVLNDYYVEVPTGVMSVGFSRRQFTEYRQDQAACPQCPQHRAQIILDFQACDVDAEYPRVAGLGVEWVTPPATQPWGNRSMIFRDPAGNLINVFSTGQADPG